MAAAAPTFAIVRDGRCSFCCSLAAPDRTLAGVDGRETRVCSGCLAIFIDILEDEPDCARGRTRRELGPEPDAEARRLWAERAAVDLRPPESRDQIGAFHERARSWVEHCRCAFCDARRPDVAKLLSAGNVFVCDRCVDAIAGVI